MQRTLFAANELVCPGTRYRLDPPDASSDASLAHDLEEANLGRVAHVSSAAELHGKSGNLHDTHDIAVFLTEQRHRAGIARVLIGHLVGRDRDRLPDLPVHQRLDLFQTLALHRAVMSKVETQPLGCDERSRLVNRLAKNLAQRRMQ